MNEEVAGKEWNVDDFPAVCPTVDFSDDRRESPDTLVLQLVERMRFMPGAGVNCKPFRFLEVPWERNKTRHQIQAAYL